MPRMRLGGCGVCAFLAAAASGFAQTSKEDPRLQQLLKNFPQADADHDGILTTEEAKTFRKQQAAKKKPSAPKQATELEEVKLPPDHVKRTEMVSMRDGVRLATDIYLPSGKGPWPVVLIRTPYHRTEPKQFEKAATYLPRAYAFVIQDWRGLYESEKRFPPGAAIGTTDPQDGYDTVEWIAKQSWSNGKVGITGGSGPGFAAKQAVVGNPPHLVAAHTSVSGAFPRDFVFYNGGVPVRWSEGWVASRGVRVNEWPRPRPLDLVTNVGSVPIPVVFGPYPPRHKEAAASGRIAVMDHGGWFDFFTPAAFDDFINLHGSNNRLVMAAKAHGVKLSGQLHYPPQELAEASQLAWFDYWLKGIDNGVMNSPPIRYFLMGDTTRPGAPGNVWKGADRWPLPNTPRSLYLHADGSLSTKKPSEKNAHLAYTYDPKDPVPTISTHDEGSGRGPGDRRELKDRKDILRFATEALTEPVEVTGRVLAELFISADVADTALFASLVDIYPNGYEAQMLNNSMMARYRNGFAKPEPMQAGKMYKISVDMWPTAVVFDKGHRIGLQVTSSSNPHWDLHPNTYEPVSTFDGSPVAHISVEASSYHASRLILPVIAPGVSKDYNRRAP